jgi:Leucine-rich repeat (LRR) protein
MKNFKFQLKSITVMVACFLLATTFTSCKDELSINVTLDHKNLTLSIGETHTLTATIEPVEIANQGIKWSSSNENIATVDENGNVTAISVGTTEIIATTNNRDKGATCIVTVTDTLGIMLDKTVAAIRKGEKLQLIASGSPHDANIQNLSWSSSDENIAVVNGNGEITAKSVGTVEITVSKGEIKRTCKVLVFDEPNIKMVTSRQHLDFSLSAEMLFIDYGDGTSVISILNDEDNFKSFKNYPNVNPHTIKIYSETITSFASSDQLTELYINNNPLLTLLYCPHNYLTSLDVSKASNLKTLEISWNQLESLKMDNNTVLEWIDAESNQLQSLDINKTINLEHLSLKNNQLTDLDVSKNTKLTRLDVRYNQLTSLDVSNNVELIYLFCSHNQLTNLNVNGLNYLSFLEAADNQLANLDVSNINTDLRELNVSSNLFTSLDISNISNLRSLYVADNQFASLDLSNNTGLRGLNCSKNQLTELDISNNTELITLWCADNQLTSLDMSQAPWLFTLNIMNNKFTTNALNDLFNTLNDTSEFDFLTVVFGSKTVIIFGNIGAADCDPTIAESKGWQVMRE